MQRAVESSAVAFAVVDSDGSISYHTPAAARLLRGPGTRLNDELFAGLFAGESQGIVAGYLKRLAASAGDRTLQLEAMCTVADGDQRWLRIEGVNLNEDGEVRGLVIRLTDVTDLRREVEQLAQESTVDPLTGLDNRRALHARLERSGPVAVLLMDVDHFKAHNDTVGHAAGDGILIAIARRLEAVCPATASLYRIGGDEFVALLPQLTPDATRALTEDILASVGAPVGEKALHVTVSIGIAHPAIGGEDGLLGRADRAMHAAKARGRGTAVLEGRENEDWSPHGRAERHSEARYQAEIVRLREASRTDERTGLLNAAAYSADIGGIDALARSDGTGYAIALCDVDYFHEYNRRYMYEPANTVLRRIAGALRAACRPGDLIYRWGGDEIAVVLPEPRPNHAAAVGERLRAAVEALHIPHEGRPSPGRVTISVGVAALDPEAHAGPTDVFAAANKRLLTAKHHGGNRVEPPPSDIN